MGQRPQSLISVYAKGYHCSLTLIMQLQPISSHVIIKIYFNTILQSMPMSSKWVLSIQVCDQHILEFCTSNCLQVYPWSWALLEKPPVAQILKNFPRFYGILRFIIVFTRALQLSLLQARSIQSVSPNPICTRSILLLSSQLRLGLPSVLFPFEFSTEVLYAFLLSPSVLHALPIASFLISLV
jgi:hypothetical protein